MKKLNKKLFSVMLIGIGLLIMFSSYGCVSVKGYQKVYLNDEDMKLSPTKMEVYDNSIESYREGASGATGGKTGGGCGCN